MNLRNWLKVCSGMSRTRWPVKISSFGTFSIRDKTARVGRNPKTGDEVPISPRRVLTFRPSHLMKDRVAAGGKT